MIVHWKCRCMPAEAQVQVPDRNDDEDVVDWVQGPVARAISIAHLRINPDCRETRMEMVKIPLEDEAKGIGFAARRH